MLVTHQPRALGRDLSALEIEGRAVCLVRRLVELLGDVAVIVEVAQLPVGRDVAPHQILALRVPGWTFSPEAAGVQPLDRGVADLGLEALVVDHDDIWIGIALRLRVAAEVARCGIGCNHRSCSKRGCAAQNGSTVERLRAVALVLLCVAWICHESPPRLFVIGRTIMGRQFGHNAGAL
ncbi:hypothetical protein ACVIGA_007061 [Bradyrhizobium sp. USDA 3240]